MQGIESKTRHFILADEASESCMTLENNYVVQKGAVATRLLLVGVGYCSTLK